MKRYLLIGLGVLIVISVAVTVAFIVLSKKETPPPPQAPALFPSAGGVSQIRPSDMVLLVASKAGGDIAVRDFISDDTTFNDPSNPDVYFIARSSIECYPDCGPGASQSAFNISYFKPTRSFTIAILEEPIGQSRIDAENYLMNVLGITSTQMCELDQYTSTDTQTNPAFAGIPLGFSFCPGAIKLP